MVVRVPEPAMIGKAIGTTLPDLLPLSPLKNSIPMIISIPRKKDDNGTGYGKGSDIESHELEHLTACKEEQQHQRAGYQRGLEAVDVPHFFLKTNKYRNRAQDIDNGKERYRYGDDLRKHDVF